MNTTEKNKIVQVVKAKVERAKRKTRTALKDILNQPEEVKLSKKEQNALDRHSAVVDEIEDMRIELREKEKEADETLRAFRNLMNKRTDGKRINTYGRGGRGNPVKPTYQPNHALAHAMNNDKRVEEYMKDGRKGADELVDRLMALDLFVTETLPEMVFLSGDEDAQKLMGQLELALTGIVGE